MEDNKSPNKDPAVDPTSILDESHGTSSNSKASNKRKAEWFELNEKQNKHVYVSGLPKTITEEEFINLMKKYGIIAKKMNLPGNPFNIKLYKDKDGQLKGDGTCGYVRVESVELAITNLDGYLYDDDHTIHCERAQFQMKGDYDPTKKPKTLGADKNSKQRQKKKIDKLLSWEPNEEVKPKKVILKNMFSPQEIDEDPSLLLDLKSDVEEICENMKCIPKRIDVHDLHPEGVIEVTFNEHEQAVKCVQTLNNRGFELNNQQRLVKADFWDGVTKYKIKETDEEREKRLSKWHNTIGNVEDDKTTNHDIPSEHKPEPSGLKLE